MEKRLGRVIWTAQQEEYISGGVGLESSSPDTPTSVLLIDNILPSHQSYDVGIFLIWKILKSIP